MSKKNLDKTPEIQQKIKIDNYAYIIACLLDQRNKIQDIQKFAIQNKKSLIGKFNSVDQQTSILRQFFKYIATSDTVCSTRQLQNITQIKSFDKNVLQNLLIQIDAYALDVSKKYKPLDEAFFISINFKRRLKTQINTALTNELVKTLSQVMGNDQYTQQDKEQLSKKILKEHSKTIIKDNQSYNPFIINDLSQTNGDRHQKWLWKNRLPLGRLGVIAARGGVGKSGFTNYIASMVSSGKQFGDGFIARKQKVLFISTQNDLSQIKAVIMSMGADDSNIKYVNSGVIDFSTAQANANLLRTIKQNNFKLVIIDPIQQYIGDCDLNNSGDVASFMDKLKITASQSQACILVVAHANKSTANVQNQANLVSGSGKMTDSAKFAYVMFRSLKDNNVYINLAKSNLGINQNTIMFNYSVISDDLDQHTTIATAAKYQFKQLNQKIDISQHFKKGKKIQKTLVEKIPSQLVKQIPFFFKDWNEIEDPGMGQNWMRQKGVNIDIDKLIKLKHVIKSVKGFNYKIYEKQILNYKIKKLYDFSKFENIIQQKQFLKLLKQQIQFKSSTKNITGQYVFAASKYGSEEQKQTKQNWTMSYYDQKRKMKNKVEDQIIEKETKEGLDI